MAGVGTYVDRYRNVVTRKGSAMRLMTADGKAVEEGHRVFNFHDWKWGVIVGDSEQAAELVHDDGSRTVVERRWVLSKDPSRSTW
jgi:hypothetical protein